MHFGMLLGGRGAGARFVQRLGAGGSFCPARERARGARPPERKCRQVRIRQALKRCVNCMRLMHIIE